MFLCFFSSIYNDENFDSIPNYPPTEIIKKAASSELGIYQYMNDFIEQTSANTEIKFDDKLTIIKIFELLDSTINNQFLSSSIIAPLFTSKIIDYYDLDNLDSIYKILLWADRYKIDKGQNNIDALFNSIYRYWYSEGSNSLSNLSEKNAKNKYSFKYRYLTQKCAENGFNVDSGNSKIEKLIFNAFDNNWSYILRRVIHSTSISFKLLLICGLLLFFISIFYVVKCTFKK